MGHFESKKNLEEVNKFVEDLPHKLRVEVSLYIYEQRYQKIRFFNNRNVSFILWMSPLLKPSYYSDNQYIFLENEGVNEIFFLVSGKASFVLPRFNNLKYININVGSHFGMIDIVGSC